MRKVEKNKIIGDRSTHIPTIEEALSQLKYAISTSVEALAKAA